MSSRQFRRGMLVATMCVLVSGVALAGSGWSWQNPLPQGNWLRNVALVNANTVIAVGDGGTILKSTNGGATWTLQSSGTTNNLWGVSCTDANTCAAVNSPTSDVRSTPGSSATQKLSRNGLRGQQSRFPPSRLLAP